MWGQNPYQAMMAQQLAGGGVQNYGASPFGPQGGGMLGTSPPSPWAGGNPWASMTPGWAGGPSSSGGSWGSWGAGAPGGMPGDPIVAPAAPGGGITGAPVTAFGPGR